MSPIAARLLDKGRVTIPVQIRRKLKLNKGDLVIFEETEAGVVIQPAKLLVPDALDEIGGALQAKGITLEELLERGRDLRGSLAADPFGLEEKPAS